MAKKVKRTSNNRGKLVALVLLCALALAVIGYGSYRFYNHYHKASVVTNPHSVAPQNTVDYSKASTAENQVNDTRKGSANPSNPNATSSPATFTVKINATSANSNVHVGSLVEGVTTGDCTLTVTKAGSPDLQPRTSIVRQDVNYYDCGVFNISYDTFPSSGSWQLKLSVTSNGQTGTDSTTVSVNK